MANTQNNPQKKMETSPSASLFVLLGLQSDRKFVSSFFFDPIQSKGQKKIILGYNMNSLQDY